MTDKNIKQADKLMEELKNILLEIMWGDKRYAYNNQKLVIPWLHEDYRYSIKKLKLPEQEEAYYLKKIEQIVGEYAEIY